MPTYEYRCKACGHELEIVQAFTDDALTTCPSCDQPALRKVFGAVGISFKGSGFYKNDSRGTSSSTSGSGSSTSTAASTGSEGTTKTAESGSSPSGDASAAPAKTEPSAKPAKSA